MKNSKFIHAGLILVLLSACQARKTQTQNSVNGNGTQTGDITNMKTLESGKRNVNRLTIQDLSLGNGGVQYVITPDRFDGQPSLYKVAMAQKGENGVVANSAAEVNSDNPDLFRTIDAIFAGKVKISADSGKNADGSDKAVLSSITVGVFSGNDQTVNNPILVGEGAEQLLANLARFAQYDDAEKEFKYSKVSVDVSGGGDQAYSIAASTQNEGAFTLTMTRYRFKDSNEVYEIGSGAGAAYKAIAALLEGKLNLTSGVVDPNRLSGTWTKIVTTDLAGKETEIKDPEPSENLSKALIAIRDYLEQRLSETHVELRPNQATCQALSLAGKWKSSLVIEGSVIRLEVALQQTGVDADGSLRFTGTEGSNGQSRAVTYKYTPERCILEKTDPVQNRRLFKVIYISSLTGAVKLAPCYDQSCRDIDPQPAYTDMILLKPVK